jgi:hypothetical protein
MLHTGTDPQSCGADVHCLGQLDRDGVARDQAC